MKFKTFITFSFIVLLSLYPAGCSLFERGAQSNPERLVTAYLEAFKGGNFDEMILLSGGWEGDLEELEFTKKFVEMIELKSYSIDKINILSQTEALVEVTLHLSLLGQEKEQSSPIRVIKKNGIWYVEGGILDSSVVFTSYREAWCRISKPLFGEQALNVLKLMV